MTARKYAVDPDGFRIDCGRATNRYTHVVLRRWPSGSSAWRICSKTRSAESADNLAQNWRDVGWSVAVVPIVSEIDQ